MKKGYKYGFKGKYCTGCGSVWEMSEGMGSVAKLVKHPDFPSYGLERENCPTCIKTSLDQSPSDAITIDKHKELLQRMSGGRQGILVKRFRKKEIE